LVQLEKLTYKVLLVLLGKLTYKVQLVPKELEAHKVLSVLKVKPEELVNSDLQQLKVLLVL